MKRKLYYIYILCYFSVFFVHPICKLFCPQKLAGIHIIHSQNNRLILLNSNFHALQKQAKRYLMQVYSFLEFYICLNESIMFVIIRLMYYYIAVVIFVLVIYMIPHWRMFTFETFCIHINAVYLGMIHGEPKTLTLADLCVHYQIPTSLQWLQPFCKYNNLIPRPHHKINHNIIAQLLYMSSYQICIHTTQTFQK